MGCHLGIYKSLQYHMLTKDEEKALTPSESMNPWSMGVMYSSLYLLTLCLWCSSTPTPWALEDGMDNVYWKTVRQSGSELTLMYYDFQRQLATPVKMAFSIWLSPQKWDLININSPARWQLQRLQHHWPSDSTGNQDRSYLLKPMTSPWLLPQPTSLLWLHGWSMPQPGMLPTWSSGWLPTIACANTLVDEILHTPLLWSISWL